MLNGVSIITSETDNHMMVVLSMFLLLLLITNTFLTMFVPSESTIILAIVGMVGLFSTAIIWQRSNKITSKYYGGK